MSLLKPRAGAVCASHRCIQREERECLRAMEIRRGGGGGVALIVRLRPGERIKAEPDALVSMTGTVDVAGRVDGGLFGGLFRAFVANESLFVQTITASRGAGEACLCAADLGDLEILNLDHHEPLLMQKGAFLASDDAVDVAAAMQKSASGALFSGAGLFVLRARGRGRLVVAAHGAILPYTLQNGETRVVDNGHLVAWSESMPYELRMAGSHGGLMSRMASSTMSGEGLMCEFTGPGKLWLQTHKPPTPGPDSKDGARGGVGAAVPCLVVMVVVLLFAVLGMGASMAVGGAGLEWASPPSSSSRHRARGVHPSNSIGGPSRARSTRAHATSKAYAAPADENWDRDHRQHGGYDEL